MRKYRGVVLVLGVAALLGLMASEGRAAGVIHMTIDLGGGTTINVDTFRTGGSATSYGDVNLANLNAALAADGSAYQFTGLGGGSNNPGTALQGQLTLTGGIEIAAGTTNTNTTLIITETEGSFTNPSGTNGNLQSASSATYANQVAGPGQTAMSAYNATSTSSYTVNSSGLPPNAEGNQTSIGVNASVIPYSLTNVLSFSLVPQAGLDVTDQFGLTATLTASTIPEPSSVAIMLTSMPVGIVLMGYFRRRRTAAV
jgi:hypothetical protein